MPEKTRFQNERDPRQIFLSHATADAEFAHKLAADLRQEGWRVWIAPDSIRPGEKWVEAIDRGLETSGVFVVALTPAAVASRWVRTETNAAIALEHRDRIHFFPLDVAQCDIPLLWSGYQFVPFGGSYEVGLDALLRRLDDGPPYVDVGAGLRPAPTTLTTPQATASERKLEPQKPTDPDRRFHEKTGIELVRIPAGPFLYGDDNQTVDLPEFWIGRYPVTNMQYKRFLEFNPSYKVPFVEAGWATPYNWDLKHRTFPVDKVDHPVVLVSWDDVMAFCDWAGLDLPSAEQWEKAARGIDDRIYPWGNEVPSIEHCNFNGHVGKTTPVGEYSPIGDSPYGCADVAGNVWEWAYPSNIKDLKRALRGGSWDIFEQLIRVTYQERTPPHKKTFNVGFRVVEFISKLDP